MSLALPSVMLKRLRAKFETQRLASRNHSKVDQQNRVFTLIQPARLELDVRLQGPTMSFKDVLELKEGQVLIFDYSLERPLGGLINETPKLHGRIVSTGQKRAFLIEGFSEQP